MSRPELIFKQSQHSIVSIDAISKNKTSTGSGWIHSIVNGRIIVITCAHLILKDSSDPNSKPLTTISCSVSNALKKGSNKKTNICVKLSVLGMDINADIAVLVSYKSNEDNFGFDFSSRNCHLNFGDSINTSLGTSVYIISNEYGYGLSMSSGICTDNSIVYALENPNYTNYLPQFISSVDCAEGSSGSPVLVYNQKPEIVGMVAWRKINNGNYVGGPNQRTIQASVEKILYLNPVCKIQNINSFIYKNFDGKTGCGFLGIGSYIPINNVQVLDLAEKYPLYKSNKLKGVRILSLSKTDITIEGSRIINAKNITKNNILNENGLKIDDIILSLNNVKVGFYDTFEKINFSSYYNIKAKCIAEVLRPSTGEKMVFEIIPDEYPSELNLVSVDPTIKLISSTIDTRTIEFPTNPGDNSPIILTLVDDDYNPSGPNNNPCRYKRFWTYLGSQCYTFKLESIIKSLSNNNFKYKIILSEDNTLKFDNGVLKSDYKSNFYLYEQISSSSGNDEINIINNTRINQTYLYAYIILYDYDDFDFSQFSESIVTVESH